MSIDKQKLQKLLWAEAASFRSDCAEWKRNTEALQDFLGEKTVEEVALELLAENERLRKQLGELIVSQPSKVVQQ
jgi:regulator of replication initiation timing